MPVYHLTLRGPLHVGEAVSIGRERVIEWLPSDSLFGAIVSAWKVVGASVAARIEAFGAPDPPFLLTSAFPRAAGIRFFPAPAFFHAPDLEGKRAKRVRWVSAAVLEQLRVGSAPDPDAANLLHDRKVWVTPAERAALSAALFDDEGQPRLWKEGVVPRVSVDRATSASNLFHAGRVSFPADGGLWFAVRGPHSDWVAEALPVLTDSGLGGLRNYGHGAFAFESSSDDLPPAPAAGPGLCLSRYAPANADEIRDTLQHPGSAYRLVTVGGWCDDDGGKPWRRRAVRLVAEGALIAEVSRARGKLADVRPEHVSAFAERGVFRFGFPFFIPAGHLGEGITP
jgi:CRISPR-associated protein Csm4